VVPMNICPAWVVGNDGGLGYYRVRAPRTVPLAQLSPIEKLAHGDDIASALVRGDLAMSDALAELRELARTKDANAQLAAVAIARAIDPIVDDRTKWSAWLAARFADR